MGSIIEGLVEGAGGSTLRNLRRVEDSGIWGSVKSSFW